MTRRRFFLATTLAALAVPLVAEARPFRRRVRRRVRRRLRRIRRRTIFRVVTGRRLLVVPIGVAVGWELMIDNRVALVQSVSPTVVVVQYEGGERAELPAMQENTPENTQDLPGSEYDAEVEEEVDE